MFTTPGTAHGKRHRATHHSNVLGTLHVLTLPVPDAHLHSRP